MELDFRTESVRLLRYLLVGAAVLLLRPQMLMRMRVLEFFFFYGLGCTLVWISSCWASHPHSPNLRKTLIAKTFHEWNCRRCGDADPERADGDVE